ncbi:MAG: hypothetical protein HYT79_07400 [Elusimicrobia bacterium]|nr:hypothetical protein [Elusimicrobiota bacterium]
MQKTVFEPSDYSAIKEFDRTLYDRLLGRPGEYPYTRGIHPDMYSKGNLPTVRKYGGFGTGAELNANMKEQIALGVTGLSIAYDLPTQMGHDPDHPLAQGEVGVTGVSVACLEDYEEAFLGILPDIAAKGIGVSKTINATAPILLAFYVAAAKKQGVPPAELRGTIQNDVLKEYLARNTFIYPLAGTLRLARDVFAWCRANLPRFNTISICGYHMREKGSTASQELAYMFANAIQYIVTGMAGGLKPDDIAAQMSFFINVKKNCLEETAKLRVARRIWAQIIKEGFGVDAERPQKLRMQSYTGGSDLVKQKPQLNIVRDAVRTLAAVLGGPQGTNTTSFDEAITIPTPLSQQIAIDTPYIVLLEKSLSGIIDPLGGSYYLESLCDRLEADVWNELAAVARCASYQKALSRMHQRLEEEAYREQRAMDTGQRLVVGVNGNREGEHLYPEVPIFAPPGDPRERERSRLESFLDYKRRRPMALVDASLKSLTAAAQSESDNVMEAILASVEAGATLGEISDTLRKVFGTGGSAEPWEPSAPIDVFNEPLRSFIGKKAAEHKSRPFSSKAFGRLEDVRYILKSDTGNPEEPGVFPYTRGLSASFKPWKPVSRAAAAPAVLADGWSYREQGADAVRELAFSFYDAMSRLSAGRARSGSRCLLLCAHNDFIEEIAKFRAARRLWAKLNKGSKLEIYARTSSTALTRVKPWNNIVRSALQALEAVLGGVQYLEILPFDSPFRPALRRATEWSSWAAQLAKDTHAVLLHEIGLNGLVDPLGGSFALEARTDEIEESAHRELDKLLALAPKEAQRYIANSLVHSLPALDQKKVYPEQSRRMNGTPIVGLNIQTKGPDPRPRLLPIKKSSSVRRKGV